MKLPPGEPKLPGPGRPAETGAGSGGVNEGCVGEDGWKERRWGGGRVGGVGGAVGWWGAEGLTCTAAGRAGTTAGWAEAAAG